MKIKFTSRSPLAAGANAGQGGGLAFSTLFSGLFTGQALLNQVAVATFLLQLISFVTTWQGAESYLGGVFPLAALLFAVAVQTTVWFFSNSLRGGGAPLRLAALGVAVACSTTFSYVGVYQFVQPPQQTLVSRYAELSAQLTDNYNAGAARAKTDFCDTINQLCTGLLARYTTLATEQASLAACRAAYEEAAASGGTLAGAVRAPSRWQYTDYTDYLAAYSAYLASVTAGTGTESEAARQAALARYGYATVEELAAAEAANAARQASFNGLLAGSAANENAADTPAADFAAGVESLRADLCAAAEQSGATGSFPAESRQQAARLLAACAAAGVADLPNSDTLFAGLNNWLATVGSPLLPTAAALEAALPGGRATRANATELRTDMTDALLTALLTVNTLLPDAEALSPTEARWQLPQVYLLPLTALTAEAGRGTAWFCLGIAALVDGLTLLFALSGRPGGSLLGARRVRRLFGGQGAVFARQVAACLPGQAPPKAELTAFLALFRTDETAMAYGYSLAAPLSALAGWDRLLALLCQANLARLLPGGAPSTTKAPAEAGAGAEIKAGIKAEPPGPTVLLKTRFLLWANEQPDSTSLAKGGIS